MLVTMTLSRTTYDQLLRVIHNDYWSEGHSGALASALGWIEDYTQFRSHMRKVMRSDEP